MLDVDQMHEFAERGYVVIHYAISRDLVANASRAIDALVEREPPGDDVRGNHFYFPKAVSVSSLIALLTKSSAWSLAESLTGPRTLEVPWQVQVR